MQWKPNYKHLDIKFFLLLNLFFSIREWLRTNFCVRLLVEYSYIDCGKEKRLTFMKYCNLMIVDPPRLVGGKPGGTVIASRVHDSVSPGGMSRGTILTCATFTSAVLTECECTNVRCCSHQKTRSLANHRLHVRSNNMNRRQIIPM